MHTLSDFFVPTIDISPYVLGDATAAGDGTARRSVAADVDYACSTVGFMQILGHGIPEDTVAGLASAMDSFFGLDLAKKRTYICPPEVNRGYTAPKSESLSLSLGVESASGMNDYFEAFNVGTGEPNTWPDSTEFQRAVDEYFAEAARVARTLTTVFVDALGVSPNTFSNITGRSLDTLRMNNYALEPGMHVPDAELTGMSEHTDYGLVTVLWADRVPGLQVLGTDRRWHDVQPADGAMLVNLGDLTARLTNDRWMSTLHRVRPPITDGTIQRRRSAAFFHDGNLDAVIAPLPSCIEPGDVARYEPVTVAGHIHAKLAGSREGTANLAATREAERVRNAVGGPAVI
ncbi:MULTISPECIES: 2-oxoglutarate and iron-dependent oxygenase domain-containing protein [unclassified Rhodococcus (in: high G+C Gram-positive bacteria)]|uniref:isopenicillin N synthase family dioxygenase n=1 Tax=unclassified Rhodococcus (in: high G+C Gram-positive bacteria) TaxID=192944 RepID=UPI0024B7AD87|nr:MULTISPECIES: 2-oxoglutarate and iron-dependent oxygenase domain-containing protein [unclassified Rhodococcus (in: high G+C Gram-positive bacteria)]MDI9928071.1 2-oxoglutarate and iron-dependent oxygenase domain-containing protein [Rhodococcus sp. IEGM 1341]MDV8075028.1 2-oxoglutarate and iron-dependent oxygenase domain-containing protein [Rhodococcus sp. IEGM 1370]